MTQLKAAVRYLKKRSILSDTAVLKLFQIMGAGNQIEGTAHSFSVIVV
jgi:hypothetical protein